MNNLQEVLDNYGHLSVVFEDREGGTSAQTVTLIALVDLIKELTIEEVLKRVKADWGNSRIDDNFLADLVEKE